MSHHANQAWDKQQSIATAAAAKSSVGKALSHGRRRAEGVCAAWVSRSSTGMATAWVSQCTEACMSHPAQAASLGSTGVA